MPNIQALNFGDLILRVSQEDGMQKKNAGAADSVPTDAAYLQRVKNAINDAREMIYVAIDPDGGEAYEWNSLRPIVSFSLPATAGSQNIDGDVSLLAIDASYDILSRAKWSWKAADSSYSGKLQWGHPHDVEDAAANEPDTTGYPRFACITPRDITDHQAGVQPGWRLRVWPKPDVEYTLTGMARRLYHPLVNLGDVEPMGPAHSQAIIAMAMFVLRRGSSSDSDRRWFKSLADEAVIKSIQYDKKRVSIVVAEVTDGDEAQPDFRTTVTHYNDTDLAA